MSTPSTSSVPSTPRRSVRRVVQRGVLPVVTGVVLGALIALAVTALLPKRYTATSRVLVTATGVDNTAQANARTSGTINLDTEAQLVTSAAVVDGAANTYTALNKLTFETIVSDISVSVPPNSSVLEIAFTADTAETARSGANAIAVAYLNDRQSNAQTLLDRQRSQARQTVQSLTTDLERLSSQLAALSRNSPDRGLLNSRIAIIKTQINGENSQIVSLGSVQVTPGRVVTAASLPDRASSPSRTINTVSGAGLGLVLGLLAAWLLLTYTRTVRRADDVPRVVDAPCLGTIGGARSAVTEQYRHVALLSTRTVHRPRRIVFAAALDSPAVSQVAVGVSEALVRSGHRTAMLRVRAQDVNGRRPVGVPLESRPSTDAIAPGEALGVGLDRVQGAHELLVIAVGSAATSADAAALGAAADAVVLVVERGTRSRDLGTAIRALDELGAPILGVVLTRGPIDVPAPAVPLPVPSSGVDDDVPDAPFRKITLEPPMVAADLLPDPNDETEPGDTEYAAYSDAEEITYDDDLTELFGSEDDDDADDAGRADPRELADDDELAGEAETGDRYDADIAHPDDDVVAADAVEPSDGDADDTGEPKAEMATEDVVVVTVDTVDGVVADAAEQADDTPEGATEIATADAADDLEVDTAADSTDDRVDGGTEAEAAEGVEDGVDDGVEDGVEDNDAEGAETSGDTGDTENAEAPIADGGAPAEPAPEIGAAADSPAAVETDSAGSRDPDAGVEPDDAAASTAPAGTAAARRSRARHAAKTATRSTASGARTRQTSTRRST